jgi:hypothetical protein
MNSRSNLSRRGRLGAVPVALAVSMCALLIAACGSSKPRSAAKSKAYVTGVKYSECMRSHGVSNFPDPSPLGGLNGGPPSTTEMQSPAFISASNTCAKLEPHGGPQPGSGFTEQQLQQMLAKARCIRQHGFPNFPDPDASGNNIGRGTIPDNWTPDTPEAIIARKACAKMGAVIPGWFVEWNGSAD